MIREPDKVEGLSMARTGVTREQVLVLQAQQVDRRHRAKRLGDQPRLLDAETPQALLIVGGVSPNRRKFRQQQVRVTTVFDGLLCKLAEGFSGSTPLANRSLGGAPLDGSPSETA